MPVRATFEGTPPGARPSGKPRSEGATPAGRRWRARLLALSFGLVLGFLALELAVRVGVGAPLAERTPLLRVRANPYRGWEMIPGEDHYTYLHPVSINSLGLRGPELPPTKDGELRVLCLGDSLTYAQGVGDEQTLPFQLERELAERAPGTRWRVINAGLRGYATNQELGLLRELGPRIEPDVVILFWYWNDLVEPEIESLYERLAASGPVTFDLNAPFEGSAALAWHARQLLRRSALAMLLRDQWRAWRAGRPRPDGLRAGLERLPGQVDELARVAAELDAEVYVVAIPDPVALLGDHHSIALAREAVGIAEQRGLPAHSLLESLRERYGDRRQPPILVFDGHYDVEPQRVMAADVAAWLLAERGF